VRKVAVNLIGEPVSVVERKIEAVLHHAEARTLRRVRRVVGVLRRRAGKPREAAIWEHGYVKALQDISDLLAQLKARTGRR
jgi:hypothetical protein